MVYQPVSQQAIADGQFWDAHDYTDRAWMERHYGRRRQPAHRALVGEVGRLVPCGRWLDIGCGPGDLLKEVADAGWQAYGIDLSPRAASLARGVGLEVVCGHFPDEAPAGHFDVISIVYAMEYFHQPKTMLTECRRRLAPGGALVLQLKNFSFWKYGERFSRSRNSIWCPQDIRTYSGGTITALLRMTGFESIRAMPANLPERPLATACLRLLARLRGPLLSPSITVMARVSGSAAATSQPCRNISPNRGRTQ